MLRLVPGSIHMALKSARRISYGHAQLLQRLVELVLNQAGSGDHHPPFLRNAPLLPVVVGRRSWNSSDRAQIRRKHMATDSRRVGQSDGLEPALVMAEHTL